MTPTSVRLHTPDRLERVMCSHLGSSVTQGCLRCGHSWQDRDLSTLVDAHRQRRRATWTTRSWTLGTSRPCLTEAD